MALDPATEELFLGIAHALFVNRLHVLRLTEVVRLGIRPDPHDQNMEVPQEVDRELIQQAFAYVSATSRDVLQRQDRRRPRPAGSGWRTELRGGRDRAPSGASLRRRRDCRGGSGAGAQLATRCGRARSNARVARLGRSCLADQLRRAGSPRGRSGPRSRAGTCSPGRGRSRDRARSSRAASAPAPAARRARAPACAPRRTRSARVFDFGASAR